MTDFFLAQVRPKWFQPGAMLYNILPSLTVYLTMLEFSVSSYRYQHCPHKYNIGWTHNMSFS